MRLIVPLPMVFKGNGLYDGGCFVFRDQSFVCTSAVYLFIFICSLNISKYTILNIADKTITLKTA